MLWAQMCVCACVCMNAIWKNSSSMLLERIEALGKSVITSA